MCGWLGGPLLLSVTLVQTGSLELGVKSLEFRVGLDFCLTKNDFILEMPLDNYLPFPEQFLNISKSQLWK